MALIGSLLILALQIYTFIIIAQVVISWLIAFGVLNTANPQAARLVSALSRATEPVMGAVRRYVPPIGGIDITPIIVIFAITLLERVVGMVFYY
ncbi:MAG: YggT family protein [Rhodospirillales bacterium]|nr:YggT family protein [Alphaproteobacteria bacterium]MCB9987050.1 YggT family protein [Rhodospirillales bacterium]USO08182.1 MAG: YggT family protein [Rhodospirillales bacterium]